MADKKKNTSETVKIRLPLKEGENVSQDEFFSFNFKNYIIKRGKTVEVPKGLAEIITNGDKAKEAAVIYASEVALKEAK